MASYRQFLKRRLREEVEFARFLLQRRES